MGEEYLREASPEMPELTIPAAAATPEPERGIYNSYTRIYISVQRI